MTFTKRKNLSIVGFWRFMPELPEVETVCRGLNKIIAPGSTILSAQLHCGQLREPVTNQQCKKLVGEKIKNIYRRAKYLVFATDQYYLLNHLGMTGSWREGQDKIKHDHFTLHLQNGKQLVFNDPRRFGLLKILSAKNLAKRFSVLGPEPLDRVGFTAEYVFAQTRGRKVAIKTWLMDQRRVVGVGNIYASEALFIAKIKPTRVAARITRNEAQQIVTAVQSTLETAILSKGTTIRDYRHAEGDEGGFQDQLKVYDRANEACVICSKPIFLQTLGGRSTYWCKSCQK